MSIPPLSFNQFSCKSLTLDELTGLCAEAGYQGIGLLIECVREMGLQTVQHQLQNRGLRATSLGVEFGVTGRDPDEAAYRYGQLTQTIEMAAALEVPLAVVLGGLTDTRPRNVVLREETEGLLRLADRAQSAGVRIAIEPLHPSLVALSTLTSLRDAVNIAALHPAISVVLDTWHVVWSEQNLEQALEDVGADLNVIHLSGAKSAIPLSDDRLMPNAGLPGLIEACAALSKHGQATWELEIFTTNGTRAQLLRRPNLAAESARRLWSAVEVFLESERR